MFAKTLRSCNEKLFYQFVKGANWKRESLCKSAIYTSYLEMKKYFEKIEK
jgi:hypothetical protein